MAVGKVFGISCNPPAWGITIKAVDGMSALGRKRTLRRSSVPWHDTVNAWLKKYIGTGTK
jgi:hypothetical protein